MQVAARQNVAQLGVVVDGRVYEGRFREDCTGKLVENALDLLLGRTCRDLHRLPRNRDAGVHDGVLDEAFGLLAVLNGLFLLALDDVFLRLGVVAVGLGLGVLLDFGGVVEDVVVVAFGVEHQKGLISRLQIELAVRGLGEGGVGQRDDVEPHALLGLAHDGVVDVAVDRKVVRALAESLVGEDLAEDDLLDLVDDVGGVDLLVFDLARHFLLGVGQERVPVARSRHIVLPHEALEAFLHRFLLRLHVGIDAVRHEDGDVSDARLDVVDVVDQVQHLQHVDVLGLYGVVPLGGVAATHEHLLDAVVELLLQRVEEAPERNQAAFVAALDRLCGLLVARQHASLAG